MGRSYSFDQFEGQKFIDKNSLLFRLLADPEKRIVNDYGLWGKKKGR